MLRNLKKSLTLVGYYMNVNKGIICRDKANQLSKLEKFLSPHCIKLDYSNFFHILGRIGNQVFSVLKVQIILLSNLEFVHHGTASFLGFVLFFCQLALHWSLCL